MTIQPSPFDLLRIIQQQQRATDQLIIMVMGMLDKSAPEMLLTGGPIAPPQLRRVSEEAARPGETVEIDGKMVHTTKRRAKLLSMMMAEPMTLSALARAGVSTTVAGVKAQIRDTNSDLERAGVTRIVRMQAIAPQRRGAKGGREPALYALLEPKNEIAPPGIPTAAQNEAAAGVSPEEAASDSAVGEGVAICPAQDAEFVTPTGGEVATVATESPSAADEPIPDLAPAAADAEARPPEVVPPQPPADEALSPEKLAAVDVLRCRVFGPNGSVYVSTRAARALDVLKHGDLFGLDHVAVKAKIPSPSDCRHALRIEEASLRSIGLEVWSDKFNVRLREAS